MAQASLEDLDYTEIEHERVERYLKNLEKTVENLDRVLFNNMNSLLHDGE